VRHCEKGSNRTGSTRVGSVEDSEGIVGTSQLARHWHERERSSISAVCGSQWRAASSDRRACATASPLRRVDDLSEVAAGWRDVNDKRVERLYKLESCKSGVGGARRFASASGSLWCEQQLPMKCGRSILSSTESPRVARSSAWRSSKTRPHEAVAVMVEHLRRCDNRAPPFQCALCDIVSEDSGKDRYVRLLSMQPRG